MHPNPAFRNEPEILHLNLVRVRSFGMLIVPGDDTLPMISHIPYVLAEDCLSVDLHLVRSNPIFRATTTPRPAMLVVNGPDGYVSPDWYDDPTHSQVPTWNYVVVHLSGQLEPRPEDSLRAHLDQLSAEFEQRLAPKRPWLADKMPPEKLTSMMRSIGVFRFRIEAIDGTWKLNQNKVQAHREGAATHIKASSIGHETDELSLLIRGIGPTKPVA
ncbi:MAG: FMN-binding negative transcriptional regulator [Pseudomonadota bacterium]